MHYLVTRRENPGWVQCPQLLRRRALPTEQREAAMLEVVAWCISNWLCTIPPPFNPSPSSPLPTGVLSGCVYLSVCYVPAFKCTVSISTFSQRGLFFFCSCNVIGCLSLVFFTVATVTLSPPWPGAVGSSLTFVASKSALRPIKPTAICHGGIFYLEMKKIKNLAPPCLSVGCSADDL